MSKRTRYDASDYPTCIDCGNATNGWWVGRGDGYASSASAVSRCHDCYKAYVRERYRRQRQAAGHVVTSHAEARARRAAARRRTCQMCASTYEARSGGSPYCEPCSIMAKRDRNRRKNVKRRRAVRLGEPYTLHEVGERDGWRCHICGRKVDPRRSGSHPYGPTIDHLIPLADHGHDSLANAALAHRACNVRRGTGGVVQLRLTG